jgi:hypothetical protein
MHDTRLNTLDVAEISEPPPRLPSLCHALRDPPIPPSVAAAPTYHRSLLIYNAARPSCPQPKLHRATTRRPRPPHLIRGRCLEIL